jgi:hypothetical protein
MMAAGWRDPAGRLLPEDFLADLARDDFAFLFMIASR